MRRTPSTWKGSPEWDAQASASSSPSRDSPASSIPSAWTGLLHDRGSIGLSTSPAAASTDSVAVEHHPGPVVVALHEPGADDLRDDDGTGGRTRRTGR